jgi:WD40 repeat protein
VGSLTFLPDGTSLISGSDDWTLKLWDIQTGGIIRTFSGHTGCVCSVSISADCTTIASGSKDKTICLWDVQTGDCNHVIREHDQVDQVVFSPTDPQHLMTICQESTQQWDANGSKIGGKYNASHTAFSADGTHFVLCAGKVAVVRNSVSGAIVARCPPDNNDSDEDFNCSCFSSDGGLVAITDGVTIYIWDITGSNPHLVKTLIGHTGHVTSITFSSSSLISASHDQSVKFWQDPVTASAASAPLNSAVIQSVTLQAKENIAISSDSAGVLRVWDLSTGLCKTSFQTSIRGSSKGSAQMVNGKLVFVWNVGRKIYIQDTEKGEPIQMAEAHSESKDLRISGDGSKVFCLNGKFIQAWSTWTGEAAGEVEVGRNTFLDPLHVDGSRIWIQFGDLSTQEWDFGIPGSPPVQISNISGRPHLHFIYDPQKHGVAGFEDSVTGKELFQLPNKEFFQLSDDICATQWDGQYLVAGYYSGQVLILDFNHLCDQ